MTWHWLGSYWAWVGSNIGALPAEALVTLLAGWIFRKPLGRLKGRLLSGVHQRLDVIERKAAAAHRIAADTHRHVTGRDHPDAPARRAP